MRAPLLSCLLILGLTASAAFAESPEGLGKNMPKSGKSAPLKKKPSEPLGPVSSGSIGGARAKSVIKNIQAQPPFVARGAVEIGLFRKMSPSVVLILTNDGLGSGSIISTDGSILTSWHVVAGYSDVGIVFKAAADGGEIRETDVVRADVVKIDQVTDLALLKLAKVPTGLTPIELGDESDIQVGADVHAIGHPTGEAWTYTKGLISQARRSYKWNTEMGVAHQADVVQTQTPINPGNSGGPLLTDNGRLIGVNAFKGQGEAMNFAVGLSDVKRFLAMAQDRIAAAAPAKPGSGKPVKKECKIKSLFEGRTSGDDADIESLDTDCDGKEDMVLLIPDDESEPVQLLIDSNRDGKPDILVADEDRDGAWDYSLHDVDFDGEIDLVGEHDDGELKPTSLSPYKPQAKK